MAEPVAGLTVELKALTTKFEQGFDKATKAVSRAEKNIKKSMGGISLAAQVQLGKDIFTAASAAARGIAELAARGDELDDLTGTFNALGGSAAQIDIAKSALLGTVSSIDLLKAANEGMIKQIPGFADNFGMIADYAGRFAEATGGDSVEALNKLTSALTTAKEKKLADLGIVINQEEAYKKYADQIGVTVAALDNSQKKHARQVEAINALADANSRLAPMGDSVNASFDALNQTLSEGVTKVFQSVASNEALTQGFREVQSALKEVDWETWGQGISNAITLVVNLTSAIAKLAEMTGIAKVANLEFIKTHYSLGRAFMSADEAQQARLKSLNKEMEDLGARVARNPFKNSPLLKGILGWTPEAVEAEKQRLVGEISKVQQEIRDQAWAGWASEPDKAQGPSPISKLADDIQKLKTVSSSGAAQAIAQPRAEIRAMADEAERAADKVKRLAEEFDDYLKEKRVDSLQSQIDEAIDTLNRPRLDGLKQELTKILRDDFMKRWQEAIASGAKAMPVVEKAADEMVEEVGQNIEDRWSKSGQQAVDSISQDAKDIGKGVAQINSLLGGQSQTMADDVAAMINPYIAAIKMAWETYKAFTRGAELDKQTKSNRGTGEAIGGMFGDLGREIGGEIGAQFKWGAKNIESRARHAFANYVEEAFEKLGQVTFRDAVGIMRRVRGTDFNFLEGSNDRYNMPGWVEQMSGWGEEAKATFSGLGVAMTALLGLTEDVGGQIGFLLGENLAGNIDNARLLVQQLGISFEDLEKALFESAMQGKITFAEFEIGITNAANAFKPGLVAVNDLKGAMDQLVGSGGRGVAALMGVRNAAVEAMEGGARTIEQLGQQMLAQGVDPTLVENFMLAIRERGIKTLEELANASDRVAAGIVAELESNDETLRGQWARMTEDLKGLAETIESIPKEKDIKLNVTTTFDKNTEQFIAAGGMQMEVRQGAKAFANGGVVSGATPFGYGGGKLGVAGEAGAEAIMPLTRIGGKLGVLAMNGGGSTGNVYHIDARGADLGVERRIRAALVDVEERAVRRSLNAMSDNSRRGGRW